MATTFTLTPQPVRVSGVSRQPMYLAADIGGYDGCDVEVSCFVEGTASAASLRLVTGMQTDTDDGWIVPVTNFPPISGSGMLFARVSASLGLLKFLRWDVSSIGGATSLTFFIQGIARQGVWGFSGTGVIAGVGGAYAAGTGAPDQTAALSTANGSQPVLKWDGLNGTPTGQVAGLQLTNTTAATSGAANQQWSPGLQFTGQQWSNVSTSQATDWMIQAMPISGQAQAGALTFMDRVNAGSWSTMITMADVGSGLGAIYFGPYSSNDYIYGGNSSLTLRAAGTNTLNLNTSNVSSYLPVVPNSDLGTTIGTSSLRFSAIYGESHYGVQQTTSTSGAVTIDPTLGEVYKLTATGNITSISINTGSYDGQRLQLVLVQKSSGSATWPTTIGNATLAGGSFTKTTSPVSALDVLSFVYDSNSTKWREVARSLNQT